eukprot:Opistho-1_new@38236
MADAEMDERTVQVKFVTRPSAHMVTDRPVAVPVRLKRYGLSEVVNHLLGRAADPVPFDILVNGEFLRTSLDTYIEQNQFSREEVLGLEYVEATAPPSAPVHLKHDDWVSCVAGGRHGPFLTGSYDGVVRGWTEAGGCFVAAEGHEAPVKAVTWIADNADGRNSVCISGSQDLTMRSWKISTNSAKAVPQCVFKGHTASVDCIAVN